MYAPEGCIKKKKKQKTKPTSSISDHSVVKSFQTQYGVKVALKHPFDL